MKKLLAAVTAALVLALQAPAAAADVTQHLTGLNPPSVWMNLAQRDVRVGDGTFWFNGLAGSSTSFSGLYANLSVVPGTGLSVAVAPTAPTTAGSLYLIAADDANAYGGFPSGVGIFLAADPTLIVDQALLPQGTTTSQLGVAAGNSTGQSIINLVECQLNRFDTTTVPVAIVDQTSGRSFTSSAQRDRVVRPLCQVRQSASSSSPVVPTVDAGWVGIGYATVPFGATSVSTITALTAQRFNGFATLGPTGVLPITQGGTGLAVLPSGGCLSYNGTAIVSVTCATSGGSGVSSATAPIVFSGGVLSCSTCVVLNPGSQQTGQISVSGPVVSPTYYVTNSVATTGNLSSDGTNLLFRAYSGGGSQFAFQSANGTSTFLSISNTQVQPVVPINSAVGAGTAFLNFPNTAGSVNTTALASNGGVSVSGVGGQTFLVTAAGVINALALDASGNLGAAGGLFGNGGAITKNVGSGQMGLVPCSACTGGGYISNAANTVGIIAWTDGGAFSAASFAGSGAGLTSVPAASLTGTTSVAHGGTGTTTPGIVGGNGVGVTGTWPNQTIAVDTSHSATFGKGSCTYSSGASANNFCDVTLNNAMPDTNYGCAVSATVSGSGSNAVWNNTVAQSTSVVRVYFFSIDPGNNTVRFGTNQSTTALVSCSEQG